MLQSHQKSIFEILGRHPIHPFPARMAPGIALEALGDSRTPLRVLDPMMGSGTVLAVARSKGHHAVGRDLDPLAVRLAGVWTTAVDGERVQNQAIGVLEQARDRFRSLRQAEAYPVQADAVTKDFVRYWFDGYARRQLACLASSIGQLKDDATREALWVGFSRLIITKSAGASLAMDLSHSRPHLVHDRAPVKPFSRFLSAVQTIIANCCQDRSGGPGASVKLGDARNLDIESESIDLVLTSPPYLNAIDYIRCSKFSLVWMGYRIAELSEIRSKSVGAEAAFQDAQQSVWVRALMEQLALSPRLSKRNEAILARYVWDMDRALAEVSRVLKRRARAVYVVGDSTVRGTFVANSEIVCAVAERNGLRVTGKETRTLPGNRRYLPPPRSGSTDTGLDGRLRREVVIAFEKP